MGGAGERGSAVARKGSVCVCMHVQKPKNHVLTPSRTAFPWREKEALRQCPAEEKAG